MSLGVIKIHIRFSADNRAASDALENLDQGVPGKQISESAFHGTTSSNKQYTQGSRRRKLPSTDAGNPDIKP